jgi:hypothetical protein
MDCRSVSAAERVCDCGEGVQCPNERKPIFFMKGNLLLSRLVCDLKDGSWRKSAVHMETASRA